MLYFQHIKKSKNIQKLWFFYMIKNQQNGTGTRLSYHLQHQCPI